LLLAGAAWLALAAGFPAIRLPAAALAAGSLGLLLAAVLPSPRRRTGARPDPAETERHFQRMVEIMPDVLWTMDLERRFTYISPAIRQLRGIEPEEAMGEQPEDSLAPTSVEVFLEALSRGEAAGRGDGVSCCEVQQIRKDGSLVWVEILIRPLLDEHNQRLGLMGVSRDITRRKDIEEDLRRMNERYDLAARAAHLGIWDWDHQQNRMTWDDHMYCLYNISREEYPDPYQAWFHCVLPEDLEQADEASLQALRGEKDYDTEFHIHGSNGLIRTIKAYGQVVRDAAGSPLRMTGVNYDITEQKKAQQELSESHKKLELLFDILPVGVSILGPDNHVLKSNSALKRILAMPEDRLKRGDYTQRRYYKPDGSEMQAHEFPSSRVLQGEKSVAEVELAVEIENGDLIWTAVSAASCPFEDWRVVLVTMDITERKKALQALQESEERFRSFIENAPTAIGISREGRTLYANPRYLELFGYRKRDEVVGKPFAKHIAPQCREELQERIRWRELGVPTSPDYETMGLGVDGQQFPIHIAVNQINLSDGPAYMVLITDITTRKQAENALKESELRYRTIASQLSAQIEENSKRTWELEALAEVSSVLRQAETPSAMISQLLQKALEVLGAQSGAFGVIHKDRVSLTTAVGPAAEEIPALFSPPALILEEVIKKGQPVFLNAGVETLFPAEGWQVQECIPSSQACIFSPIISQASVTGVLCLFYAERVEITEVQKRITMAISEMAGNALRRMVVSEELVRYAAERLQELETIYQVAAKATRSQDLDQTLQEALISILAAVKANFGAILLPDNGGKKISAAKGSGKTQDFEQDIDHINLRYDLLGWVQTHKQLRLFPNLGPGPKLAGEPQFPIAALPMRVGSRVLGMLELARQGDEQFDVEELTLLAFLADHLGLIVENASLFREAEQKAILEERSRLARDLHDSVTQSLYSATLFAEGTCRLADLGELELVKQKLQELSQITQQALKDMRLMVYELRSPALDTGGLVRAIQDRLEAVELRSGIHAELQYEALPDLPAPVEEAMYRITQEALNNLLKHAQARQVVVQLREAGGKINLVIADDGVGFIPGEAAQSGGLGLTSIRERAESLGGSLSLRSRPGLGTEICVLIPWRSRRPRRGLAKEAQHG
jgi:PAS domain S-box-containing protein